MSQMSQMISGVCVTVQVVEIGGGGSQKKKKTGDMCYRHVRAVSGGTD
jgi:hypothetical protein